MEDISIQVTSFGFSVQRTCSGSSPEDSKYKLVI